MMSRFLNYFFKGLIVIAPVFITVYVCVLIFTRIDSWLGLPIPGVGFAITIVLITLAGFIAQTFFSRAMFSAMDEVIKRLPFVRLIYSSARDLVDAFVGEKRRFDKPVLVTLQWGGTARAFGIVTRVTQARVGLTDHVAVYHKTSSLLGST